MSTNQIEMALNLIETELADRKDFCGPQSQVTIDKAEKTLNVTFPKTYKIFLQKYGCGNIGSFEIYGIIKDEDFDGKEIPFVAIPNVVWTTLQWRKDYDFPSHLVIVSDGGDGSMYCLDTSKMNNEAECPVILSSAGKYEASDESITVARNFGTFLLNCVRNQMNGV